MRTRRESTRINIVDFLNYLSNRTGLTFITELPEKRFFDDVLECRLEIAKYLQRCMRRDDPNAMIVKSVIDRIKVQLSDYAWMKIYKKDRPEGSDNYYISDEALAESREGSRMYIEKSGRSCSFYYNGKKYHGTIDRIFM